MFSSAFLLCPTAVSIDDQYAERLCAAKSMRAGHHPVVFFPLTLFHLHQVVCHPSRPFIPNLSAAHLDVRIALILIQNSNT